jgi:ABC-type nitrate/sulfonate/bicarbonate transport system permease component
MRARTFEPLLALTVLVTVWQLASMAGWLNPVRFPSPAKLAQTMHELAMDGFPQGVTLGTHFAQTLQRILAGFTVSVAIALPAGLVIGSSAVLDRFTAMVIAFCRSVATLSLLPIALVWFGTGESSKMFLIAYGCFWVMLSNVIAAVKQVDPVLVCAARTMDAGPLEVFTAVVLPAVLPRTFSGARISIGVGFMVIVGAEMIGTVVGLGALIMEARTFYRTDITMVGMLVLGVIGFAINSGLLRFEHRLMPWTQRQQRKSE